MNEFKLIIAGGRDFNDYGVLSREVFLLANVTYQAHTISVVSGMAPGADTLGHRFAKQHGLTVYEFPADWNRLGKRAGFMRNEDMGKFSDGLLAFWDGKSKGTAHMIQFMKSLGKPVHIVKY